MAGFDLTCGALSADIGDPQTKIVHAWANDIDADACRTYRRNICHDDCASSVICKDVRELEINRENLSDVNAFAFGFPCNDFSVVGERRGFGENFLMCPNHFCLGYH